MACIIFHEPHIARNDSLGYIFVVENVSLPSLASANLMQVAVKAAVLCEITCNDTDSH